MTTASLVYFQTPLGGFIFDAILALNHERTASITSHPVETGAAVTDHAFIQPSKLTLQVGMSDALVDVIAGQFANGPSRSVTAYQTLVNLQQLRIPFDVATRLGLYRNMLIQSIVTPDDHTTAYGLKATVTLQEIFVASVRTVRISAQPQTTDSTNRGDVQAQPLTPQSPLYSQFGLLIGNSAGTATKPGT